MAEHVLIVEAGVPVAGVQKTTICTFTIKGEEENEGLYPRILFLDVVPHNMSRSVSSTSDNGHYVTHGRLCREERGIDMWGEAGTVVLPHLLTE